MNLKIKMKKVKCRFSLYTTNYYMKFLIIQNQMIKNVKTTQYDTGMQENTVATVDRQGAG